MLISTQFPRQLCIRCPRGGYWLPHPQNRFVIYDDSDYDFLRWGKMLRPAGRGEGRTMRDIADAAEILLHGLDVGFVARNIAAAESLKPALVRACEAKGLQLSKLSGRKELFFSNGTRCSLLSAWSSLRGLRCLLVPDHAAFDGHTPLESAKLSAIRRSCWHFDRMSRSNFNTNVVDPWPILVP